MKVKAIVCGLSAAALMTLATPAMAQDQMNESGGPPAADPVENADGMKVSFGVSAATDYVFRGISQTDNKPGIFGTVSLNYKGFYAGTGAENVDFAGVHQEYDLWAGYVLPLSKTTSLDVGVVRYGYVDAPVNFDTIEVKTALSTKVGQTSLGISGFWTPNYFGSDDDAIYGEVTAAQPLTDKLTLSGAFGYQQISAAKDYTTWNVGARYAILPGASIDVRYYDTDTDRFGRSGKARIVGSFAVSF